jgi:hypothetical protein
LFRLTYGLAFSLSLFIVLLLLEFSAREVNTRARFFVDAAPDAYEPDDTWDSAREWGLVSTHSERHNFHNAGDVDWIHFRAAAGYQAVCDIYARKVGSTARAQLDLYDAANSAAPLSHDASAPDAHMHYESLTLRDFYARARPFDSGVNTGEDSDYGWSVACALVEPPLPSATPTPTLRALYFPMLFGSDPPAPSPTPTRSWWH